MKIFIFWACRLPQKRQFLMKYHLENYNEIWRTNEKDLKVAQVINFFVLLPHE